MLDTVRGRLPPTAPLLAVVAVVLVLAVLASAGDSAVQVGQGWIPGFGPADPAPPTETGPALRTDDFETPTALRAAAVIGLLALSLYMLVLLLVGLAMLVAGVRYSRRRRLRRETAATAETPEDEPGDAGPLLRSAAAAALQRLRARTGAPPADAVVAAWLELERAAAEAGHARKDHETPTEYAAGMTARLRVGEATAAAIQRLRLLYQRARFGDGPIADADATTAEDALARIVADLDPDLDPASSRRCDIVPVGPGERHIVPDERTNEGVRRSEQRPDRGVS